MQRQRHCAMRPSQPLLAAVAAAGSRRCLFDGLCPHTPRPQTPAQESSRHLIMHLIFRRERLPSRSGPRILRIFSSALSSCRHRDNMEMIGHSAAAFKLSHGAGRQSQGLLAHDPMAPPPKEQEKQAQQGASRPCSYRNKRNTRRALPATRPRAAGGSAVAIASPPAGAVRAAGVGASVSVCQTAHAQTPANEDEDVDVVVALAAPQPSVTCQPPAERKPQARALAIRPSESMHCRRNGPEQSLAGVHQPRLMGKEP